jgi:hypothetical protein
MVAKGTIELGVTRRPSHGADTRIFSASEIDNLLILADEAICGTAGEN